MWMLLSALLSLNLLPAHAEFRGIHKFEHGCLKALRPVPEDLEIVRTYVRYQTFRFENHEEKGFELIPVTANPKTNRRSILIPVLKNPLEKWRAEIWQSGAEKYTFFDIGFRNMEQDAKMIDEIVYDHIMNHPHERLRVDYGPRRREQVDTLRTARFTVHGRVLDAYEIEKPYLRHEDMWALYLANKLSTNNDVIAIFKNDPAFKWKNQTIDTIERDLISTIQVTYYGDEDYFEPTLRGVMRAAGDVTPFFGDRFPFEHRLSKQQKDEFRKTLFAQYDPQTSCEITRYANFIKNMPRAVTDRLIFETLKRIVKRGVKTIFVAADDYTIRLFRRYGIRPYADLPTGTNKHEILGVLEVESETFRNVYAKLMLSSIRVQAQRIHYNE